MELKTILFIGLAILIMFSLIRKNIIHARKMREMKSWEENPAKEEN